MKLKTILIRFTSIFLLFVMLCTAISASSVTYRDVSPKHWAYDSIVSVTEAGLMHGKGKTAGEYFVTNEPIKGTEIFATLYRLAGNPEVIPTFVDKLEIKYDKENSKGNKWYTDSRLWAMYNGISYVEWLANNVPEFYTPEVRWGRYGSELRPAKHWTIDYQSGKMYGDERDALNYASRADVILALYYYVTTYLGIEVTETATLSKFPDWREDQLKPSTYYLNRGYTTGKFGKVFEQVVPDEFTDACEWAVGAGIIEGYPDGTLRLQYGTRWDETVYYSPRVVTRAEYAVILDRFMQYLEEIK